MIVYITTIQPVSFSYFFLCMYLCIHNYILFNIECKFPRGLFSYYLFSLFTGLALPWHPLGASCPNSSTQQLFSRQEFIVSTRQQTLREICIDHFFHLNIHKELVYYKKLQRRYEREGI